MTDERSKTQSGEGRASSQPSTAEVLQGALRSSDSQPPRGTEKAVARRPTPAPEPEPRILAQAEEGSATARREAEEQCRKAKARANLEVGGVVTVVGFTVLSGCLCLPKEAKHPSNTRFTVSLLLAFATFLSGKALMLLSMNMLGLQESLVSGGQRVAARCLFAICTALSGLTLVSLLALMPGMLYLCIGLPGVMVVALPVLGVHWYLSRRGGDEAAAYEQHKEQLDAASKTTSCVTNSAFGGLVGVLLSASKVSAGATRSAYVAIFFMFSTAISGMFVMTVSKRVPKIKNRRLLIGAIRLANAFLLCSLAYAAFAAAFVVLGWLIFAAFAPLAVTAFLCLVLRHRITSRSSAGGDNEQNQDRIKAMEDIASKVTAATLGAIMSVLGGSIGEKEHENTGAMDVFMVVLTSAFVSGFGFMLLAAVPGSARARLALAAKVLVWSSTALFAATAVAVYGVEV